MDNSVIFNVACVKSPPARHQSDTELATISTNITDSNAWDSNDELISFLLSAEPDQEWDIFPSVESIPTPGVAINPREWDPSTETISSLLPSMSFQDSYALRPLKSPSSRGVVTSANLKISSQNYQDISDTRMNIQGVENSTNQDVGILEAKIMFLEGIPLAREYTPLHAQTTTLDSGKRLRRHSERAVAIMIKWFDENIAHPYPSSRELIKLCNTTHLLIDQVNTWFSNERQRRSKGKVGMTLKMKNKLPDDSIRVLKAWVNDHSGNSRPTATEKKFLAQEAELKLQQVSDWFGNYRKKQIQPQHEEVQEDHECFIEMREKLQISDLDTREAGNVAEFQDQNIGVVFPPKQDHHPEHILDSWDEDLLLSSLNALLDQSQIEAEAEARTLN